MAIGVVFATSKLSLAATQTPAPAANSATVGQGLEISPPLVEIKGDPGQTLTLSIRLRNVTGSTVVTQAAVNDFTAKDELGDPQIILDPNETSSYSLRTWVTNVQSLTLASKEAKTATAIISIPKNAEPGGHYGVIRFTALPPGISQTGVALSASIGELVLLDVSGNTHEHLSFADFYIAKNGTKHSFFESGPFDLVERVKNDGNLHEKPTGAVDIFNTFGHKIASLKINDPPHNILPASIRRFDQSWRKSWLVGRYRARATLSYGPDQTQLVQSIVFWVIPWRLILIVLAALIVITLLLRFTIKSYNARIIRRAQGRNQRR